MKKPQEHHGVRACLMLFVVSLASVVQAEDVTITTYYPSPRGNYQTLNSTSQTNLATGTAATDLVGIGTTSPRAKLSIANNVATGFLDNYSEYQQILFDGGTAGSSYGFGIKGNTIVFNSGMGAYSFDRAGNATAMVIDTSGNVGIGDTTPDHLLDVAGNIGLNASSYINFGDTDGTSGYGVRDNTGTIEVKNSGGSWTAMGAGGGVGPGTTDYVAKFTGANTVGNSQISDDGAWVRMGGALSFGPGGGDAYIGGSSQDGNIYVQDAGGTPRVVIDTWGGGANLRVDGAAQFNYDSSGGSRTTIDDIGVRVFNPEGQNLEVRLGAPWNLPGVYSSGNLGLYSGSGQNILLDNALGRVDVSSDLYVANSRVCTAGNAVCSGGSGVADSSKSCLGGQALQAFDVSVVDGEACVAVSGGGGVTGGGTTNYVAKWTGATALGNSSISDGGSGITVTYPGGSTEISDIGVRVFDPESTGVEVRLGGPYNTPGVYSSGNLYLYAGGASAILNTAGRMDISGDAYVASQRVCRADGTGCPARTTATCSDSGGTSTGCTATCPAGYTVTGGGVNNAINGQITGFDSVPNSASSWRCGISLTFGGTNTMTCYAVCIKSN